MDNIQFLVRIDHMKKLLTVSVSHPSMTVGSRLQFSLFPFQKVYKVYQEREWSADRTLTLNGPT